MSDDRDQLEMARCAVSAAMDDILELFRPGAKITVYVRRPDALSYSQDLLMSNDDVQALADNIKGFLESNVSVVSADSE